MFAISMSASKLVLYIALWHCLPHSIAGARCHRSGKALRYRARDCAFLCSTRLLLRGERELGGQNHPASAWRMYPNLQRFCPRGRSCWLGHPKAQVNAFISPNKTKRACIVTAGSIIVRPCARSVAINQLTTPTAIQSTSLWLNSPRLDTQQGTLRPVRMLGSIWRTGDR